MNENSEGFALQNINVTQRIAGISLFTFLLLLIASFVVLHNNQSNWQKNLEGSAVKQKKVIERFILPMIDKAQGKSAETKLREDFNKLEVQTIIVKNKKIVLSSYKDEAWKSGAEFTKELANKNTPIIKNKDIVWFIWDATLNGHVGIVFSADGFEKNYALLKILISAFIFLAAVLNFWFIRGAMHREVHKPLGSLSKVFLDMSQGKLSDAASHIEALNQVWNQRGQHEIHEVLASAHTLQQSLQEIEKHTQAIANDDLTNPMLDEDHSGDLWNALQQILVLQRGLVAGLKGLASGNFDEAPIPQLKPDGTLGQTFFQMRDGVQLLLERLSRASEHLRTSAHDLQESSSTQASAATKQADGVTETMATMEELAASSGHIADTAKHVVLIAEQTLENARDGQDAVENVGQGMEDIVKASLRGAERLFNLDEKSRSISRVATLIANVAEQSKILALNAAIEAAHAGEAGRGFSVVAEEVRNLANSVFESTRDIENLINEIQSEIRQAVQASEEEVKRANKGRDLAQNAQGTIVSIFSSAEKMTQAAHQIELATNQQRSASGQVATAVREMATSAEQVAKGAKTVRVSLNDLGNLAQDLREIVGHFEERPPSNVASTK
ncbi:MAG: methyl-accepting chemotaxis protein [Planctomycetota bacterium]|nr:methyl-accepting chemotaxis protein [Planctomycetota bacterium]